MKSTGDVVAEPARSARFGPRPALVGRAAGALMRGSPRSGSHAVGAALGGSLLFMAVTAWLTWPRFSIKRPALIDDWYEIRWSGYAFHQLVHFAFSPASYDANRFRPGAWLAAWVRWHLPGGPSSMSGPNLWNLARVWLFGIGLCVAVIASIRPEVRRRLGRWWLVALGALPGLAVISTPGLVSDFLRLMPQEPLLIGASAAGLVLLMWAVRLSGTNRGAQKLGLAALVVVGGCLWAFGVTQKEASLMFVCLVPFILLELRGRWAGGRRLGPAFLAVVALVLIVPIAYMAIGVAGLPRQSTLIYGASTPTGIGGWLSRLHTAVSQQWGFLRLVDGGRVWQGVCEALPFAIVWKWARDRRPPWIPIGLSVLAVALLAFQGIPLVFAHRYLGPVCAVVAVAIAVLAAELPSWARGLAVGAGALFVLFNVHAAHNAVTQYVADARDGTQLVDAVSALHPSRCPVYLVHIDIERRGSIPQLVTLHGEPGRPCTPGYQAVMVNVYNNPYLGPRPGVTDDSLLNACSPPGWQQIEKTSLAVIAGCSHLQAVVHRSGGTTAPISEVLASDRIVVPLSPYAHGIS